MILEIDAGNSFIKWRVLNETGLIESGRLTHPELAGRIPASWQQPFAQVRIASVAGELLEQRLKAVLRPYCATPLFFARTQSAAAGVFNSYSEPSRMGVDRWLVMLAAFNDCHDACCVIDCGSAITVDFVAADGLHQGGYIMPGLKLMTDSLLKDTARIRFTGQHQELDWSPGRDTGSAVANGVGFLFKALQEKLQRELGDEYRLYITGGDGERFHQLIGKGSWCEHLVMDGLRWSQQ